MILNTIFTTISNIIDVLGFTLKLLLKDLYYADLTIVFYGIAVICVLMFVAMCVADFIQDRK